MLLDAKRQLTLTFNDGDILKHLEIIKRKSPVNFRAFNLENKAIKFKSPIDILKHSDNGYGIYFVVNNGGDKDADITECTALFAEFDDIPKDEQLNKFREMMSTPTLLVDTGGKSIHAYWVLSEPVAPKVWKPLQTKLLDYLGCDRTIKNPSRVMRLAGTRHQKTGQLARIIECSPEALYKPEDFSNVFPEHQPKIKPSISWTQYQRDFQFRNESIDLIAVIAPKHRELIYSGVCEGERDNTAAAIARDLIGTANYLDNVGQSYEGEPYSLLENFCNNCKPPLSGADVSRIYESAIKDNPKPCLDEDKIRNIVAGIFRKREQPNLYKDSPKSKDKVVYLNQHLDLLQTKNLIIDLVNQNLAKSDIELKLAEIAKLSGFSHYQIEKIFTELLKETDKDDSIKEDISHILDAQESSCDLLAVTPPNLANPLKRLAGLLSLRPELYLQSLITTMATLVNPATKIVVSEAMGWEVSPNIFSGIVAPSSQKKSPILKASVTKPMAKLRKAAKDEFLKQKQEYLEQIQLYLQLKKEKSTDLSEHFPNGEPSEPTRYKIYYQDNSTTEGIVNQLNEFPNQGTLLLRDELAGLFKSANAYRGGRGSDTEDLLKFYDGGSHTVLRAGGVSADIDNVLLSIIGGVQPAILEKLLGSGDDDNGQWARFDFIVQSLVPSVYSDSNPVNITGLIAWIYESINYCKESLPDTFYLSQSAKEVFKKAYDRLEHKRCNITSTAAMQHVYGKAEGKIAKYALQFHILDWLFEHNTLENLPNEISVQSVQSSIKWVSFLIQQVKGIYAAHDDNSGKTKLLTKIAAAAKSIGDWVTPKDVRSCIPSTDRKKINSSEIKSMFLELETMGYGITTKDSRTLKFLYQKSESVQSVQKVSRDLDTKKITSNPYIPMDVNQGVQSVQSVQTFGKTFTEEKNKPHPVSTEIDIGIMDESGQEEKNLFSGHLGHLGHYDIQTQSQQQNESVQKSGHSNGHFGHLEKNQDTLGESERIDNHSDQVKNESVQNSGHLEKNQDTYPDVAIVDGVNSKNDDGGGSIVKLTTPLPNNPTVNAKNLTVNAHNLPVDSCSNNAISTDSPLFANIENTQLSTDVNTPVDGDEPIPDKGYNANCQRVNGFLDKKLSPREAYDFIKVVEGKIDVDENQLDLFSQPKLDLKPWQSNKTIKPYDELKKLILDIETSGLDPECERIYSIGLQNQHGDKVTTTILTKEDEKELLREFREWLKSNIPDVVMGHNIHTFDIPFLLGRAKKHRISLPFGINDYETTITSSSFYGKPYKVKQCKWSGKSQVSIVDTLILAAIYEKSAAKLPNFKLKDVAISIGFRNDRRLELSHDEIQECWETKDLDRLHEYLNYDLDDTRALADYFLPIYHYQTLVVPNLNLQAMVAASPAKKWEQIAERFYGFTPKSLADEKVKYGGAIIGCNKGLYRNAYKLDVSSMYPSIILTYELHSHKDKAANLIRVMRYLTEERLRLKKLYKETKGDNYNQQQNAMKILINGGYGFFGTGGYPFNDMKVAALVPAYGRALLKLMLNKLENLGVTIAEWDTDGIICCDGNPDEVCKQVQSILPTGIEIGIDWENNDIYIPKSKTYIIYDSQGKIKRTGIFRKRDRSLLENDFPVEYVEKYRKSPLEAEQFYQETRESLAKGSYPVDNLKITKKISASDKTLTGAGLGSHGEKVTFYYAEEKRISERTGKPIKSRKTPVTTGEYWGEHYLHVLDNLYSEIIDILKISM